MADNALLLALRNEMRKDHATVLLTQECNVPETHPDVVCLMSRDVGRLSLLAKYSTEIPMLNPPLSVAKIQDRGVTFDALRDCGVPVPNYRVGDASQLNAPVVAKSLHSHVNECVRLITNRPIGLPESTFYQEYVASAAEFKLYIVGDRVHLKQTKGKKILQNEIDESIVEPMRKMGEISCLNIFGADIIVNRKKELFVIDVNDFPSFAGVQMAPVEIKHLIARTATR
jgi:glutathione synthase/RimK-type ligase-like ATP-grasp enzyme